MPGRTAYGEGTPNRVALRRRHGAGDVRVALSRSSRP